MIVRILAMITMMESVKQIYFMDMKLILVSAKKLSMGSFLTIFNSMSALNIVRVTNKAVNMLAIRPMDRVTANPLMGPEPNWNSMNAAMSVVVLESTMALRALLKPLLIAAGSGRSFRVSSRMRSLIRMLASTAMPKVKMMPAMPGNVSVSWLAGIKKLNKPMIPVINSKFIVSAKSVT